MFLSGSCVGKLLPKKYRRNKAEDIFGASGKSGACESQVNVPQIGGLIKKQVGDGACGI